VPRVSRLPMLSPGVSVRFVGRTGSSERSYVQFPPKVKGDG
jgi:hypothetical protein